MSSYKVHGIFAPIPTPFTLDGQVAYDRFAENVRKFGETPLDGIVVMGSNGEAPLLREEERIRLMSLARENFPREKQVIAGTGCESAQATRVLNEAAAAAGLDAVLVINPSFYRGVMTNPDIIEAYYTTVADESPAPVMLYNMPGNSGINLPAGVVSRLSRHANIIGVKDSGGNIAQISSIIKDSEPGFCVFAGSASFLLPTLYMGGCGGTLATANVAPGLCAELVSALALGDHQRARNIQMRLLDINTAVTTGYGIPGLKYAVELLGYYGGPTRSPLRAYANDAAKADIKRIMRELELI